MSVPSPNPPATQPKSDWVDEFFAKVGPEPTAYDELRRFPRFYYRTVAEALIHPPDDAADRAPQKHLVLTGDLSRGGFSLRHVETLTPGQRIEIVFNNQEPRLAEVLWCRPVEGGGFAVGCRFVKA
jgi:hypothetical protein